MNLNTRQIAFETLYKIFYNDAYSNLVIDDALSEINDGKAFVTRLVYGVVERKITLDYIIEQFCQKPKPKVLIILRLGVYQLYFMDKVPVSAAINECVKLAKNNGLNYYSKLINAVLHKVNDNRIDIEAFHDLSVKYSVPKQLINMWIKAYGEENVKNFLPAINDKPPIFIIPNTKFVDCEELQFELECEDVESEVCGDVLKLISNCDVSSLKSFKNGLFHVEDISCYNAVKALNPVENDVVFDVCSAPGGKAFTCAEFMNNKGKIFAMDVYESRVGLIENGAKRLELSIINSQVNDAAIYNPDLPKADKIICDVPCSGFGIVRRKPEIRYKNLDDIKNLPDIQYKILETSSKYLKKGGRILYSTCTLNKRENEKVVELFVENNKDFKIILSKTVFPGENEGDGFFYSLIERN